MSKIAVADTSSNEHDVKSMALYLTRLNSSSRASHDSCESVSCLRFKVSVLSAAGLSRLIASRCSIIDGIGAVLCFSHDRRYRFESSLGLEIGTDDVDDGKIVKRKKNIYLHNGKLQKIVFLQSLAVSISNSHRCYSH